jgi:diaminohydroxyphosphoribosylaminopyrimidine deaminase/5-amino-6-(5-phosphoribosylamino)uracil reductase
MVGCIIIDSEGRLAGEGFHPQAGQPHAEVFALRAAGEAARGATAYVTLEPCSHHGRTPPCADALLNAGIRRVVVAMADPDSRVAGRGIARLREGGIAVEVGLMEAEARALNAAYIKHRATGIPWVVLKTAMSLDGKIATRAGHSQWITSQTARRAVHRQLRDRADAVLTGVGTVLADDPLLTTRLVHKSGRNPLRVILDSRCRIPLQARVVQRAAEDGLTLIVTTAEADDEKQARLRDTGCRIVVCPAGPDGRVDVRSLLSELGTSGGVIGVLAEGGGRLAASLLEASLVDRWLAFIAPKVIGGDDAPGPVGGLGAARIGDAQALCAWRMRRCGVDIVIDARFG